MKMLTVGQVAKILQVSAKTVYQKKHEIGFMTVGTRTLRCSEKTLKKYIAGHKSEPVGKLNLLSMRVVKEMEWPSLNTPKLAFGKSTSKSLATSELDALLRQPIDRMRRSCTTS